ncbi:hypothetical protein SteCoe_4871 [Stentor coeruleus]|uniref:Uncharacterized protein n=1 Tax=Stentor coeruleus TaxID=5963 RepID=A0A1R2CTX8_9CILI|nr:hypothetical protein SteCoe_4871 [Stentor coeruleus]
MLISYSELEKPIYSLPFQKIMFKSIQNIELVDKILSLIANNMPIISKSSIPLFVVKFSQYKRFYYSMSDLLKDIPNFSSDYVVQRYIAPKGLKAIKYRVVLNKFQKVIIFSNKNRIDAKIDDFIIKNPVMQAKKIQDIERTVVMHRGIMKAIKNNNESKSFYDIHSISQEKLPFFNIFHKTNEKKPSSIASIKTIKASERFLTHSDEDVTEFFEGKNQSFAKIIQMTEYLKDKIDNYYLDGTRIIELAVDYLQDANGVWYMLKIKYGKVESKFKDIKKTTGISKIKKKKNLLKAISSLTKIF